MRSKYQDSYLGRRWADPVVAMEVKRQSVTVAESALHHFRVLDSTKVISPEQVAAEILGVMKHIAEDYLGYPN